MSMPFSGDDVIDLGGGLIVPAVTIRDLFAACVEATSGDGEFRLMYGIRDFVDACGLTTTGGIEAATPAAEFAEFTGHADATDFHVRVEYFPAGTVESPPAGIEPHICSIPTSLMRYVEGPCPRCGRDA